MRQMGIGGGGEIENKKKGNEIGEHMEAYRVKGNELFAKGNYAEALVAYEKGLELGAAPSFFGDYFDTETADDRQEQHHQHWVNFGKLCGNACSCLWAQRQYVACCQRAKDALRFYPLVAKAYGFIGMCLLQAPFSEIPHLVLCHGGNVTVAGRQWEAYRHISRALCIDASLLRSLQPYLSTVVAQMEAMCIPMTPAVEVRPKNLDEEASQVGVYAKADMTSFTLLVHERAFSVGYHMIGEDTTFPLCMACAERCGTQRCPKCHVASFCCRTCAVSYHERHIRYECTALRMLMSLVSAFREGIALVMHIITTWSGYKMRVPGFKALDKLARNKNIPVDNALRHVISLLLCDSPSDLTDRWAVAIKTNAFQRPDYSTQLLYAGGVRSRFNHSCNPNMTVGFELLRPIAAGEEICFDYPNDLFFLVCPTARRRDILWRDFLFYCRCPRCERGSGDPFERALLCTRKGQLPSGKEEGLFHRICALFIKNIPLTSCEEYDALYAELKERCLPCHYLSQLFIMGPRHLRCHATVAQYARWCFLQEVRDELPLPWLTMSHEELLRHGARYRRPF